MSILADLSIRELREQIRTKKISALEVAQAAVQRAQVLAADTGAFNALASGEQVAQQVVSRNVEGPLYGIPYSVKDAYCTTELPTTAGSSVLTGYQSPYDATVHMRCKEAGAVLIGKNSQDAWGHGSTTENTDMQVARNPWNTSHVAGGSSGGSAAAVAAGLVSFAIGEDTGGSIRNPAAFCGITGLKVTYGRVSRFGAIAYASSLDTVGPMARSVEDIAEVLQVIAGPDRRDATSSPQAVPEYRSALEAGIRGKKVGLPKEFYAEGLDTEARAAIETAQQVFTQLGAELVEVSIPLLDYAIPLYYLIAMSETSSNLARYDGIRYGQDRSHFTAETMRRIMMGTFALSAGYADKYYKNAQKARNLLRREYAQAFTQCDVLLSPVTPGPAPKFGELIDDTVRLLLEDRYTVTVNPVGVPSLALPMGFTRAGLPLGMQLIGKHFHEDELLSFGHAYQQTTDWHRRRPSLSMGKENA